MAIKVMPKFRLAQARLGGRAARATASSSSACAWTRLGCASIFPPRRRPVGRAIVVARNKPPRRRDQRRQLIVLTACLPRRRMSAISRRASAVAAGDGSRRHSEGLLPHRRGAPAGRRRASAIDARACGELAGDGPAGAGGGAGLGAASTGGAGVAGPVPAQLAPAAAAASRADPVPAAPGDAVECPITAETTFFVARVVVRHCPQ
jgi:hypothetical protein